uniref:Ig-like domain-containing protein n=1 Tax=Saccharothrix mutabilis TaxID=33921 RepID=UPI0031CDB18A
MRVRLNTSPVNRPPAAVDDAFTRRVWSSALRVPAPGVLGNDTDPDGGPLTARLVDGPRHGTLTPAADGSFHYRARSVVAGEDSFTYEVVDAAGAVSAPAKVTIRVGF